MADGLRTDPAPIAGRPASQRGGPGERYVGDAPPPIQLRTTREGRLTFACVGLLALLGLAQGELLLFLLCCFVLGSALACRPLARRNLSGIRVTRRLPHRTRVGTPTPLRHDVVSSRRRATVGLEIGDRPGRGVEPPALVIEVPAVSTHDPARCLTHVTFRRRGLFAVETLTLSSRFPLGLVRAEQHLTAPSRVLVHPSEGRATARLVERLRGLSQDAARRRTPWSGDDLLHGVREFRAGDDPRRIHWRTTARRGALTVTEWHAHEEGEVLLVLGRATGAGADMDARFERAVSVAATIWRLLARRQRTAQLVLDDRTKPLASRDRTALVAGLDRLARVPPQKRSPLRALSRSRTGSDPRTVIYVGTGPEPRADVVLASIAGRRDDVLHLRVDRATLRHWVGGVS